MSVSIKPGATQLTVIWRDPISQASERVNPSMPAFACRIVGLSGIAHRCDYWGDIDNATLPRFHHAFYGAFTGAKHRGQIHVEHALPGIVIHPHEQTILGNTGIVD